MKIKGKRDLLSMTDLSTDELLGIVEETAKIKKNPRDYRDVLDGMSILMIFEKPSTRTRISFECGIEQLGGHAINLTRNASQLDRGETVSDSARVLERYVDAVVARVMSHSTLTELACNAKIPVINALSDIEHPCQTIADLYTIYEIEGRLDGVGIAYIGDGNNVCNSLMLGCAMTGMNLRIAAPEGYLPPEDIRKKAEEIARETGASILIGSDPRAAVEGADYVYTDVWVSMGQEDAGQKKALAFEGFQVNEELLEGIEGIKVMHCLPAHRGMEISAGVLDGPDSIVWDQAENRLHTQKTVLMNLLGKG